MLLKDLSGCCRRGQEGKQGKVEVMEAGARVVAMVTERGSGFQSHDGVRTGGGGGGKEGGKEYPLVLA